MITPSSSWLKILADDGAQGLIRTPFNSIAAVRKSVYDPGCENASAAKILLMILPEVAQLELDADWVVLSACNTAAGEKGDAEALAGLARAFFYAKARALLVSHWPVNSDAAVKLTTRAFEALKINPSIGRSEALRRSMVELITGDRPQEGERASELHSRGFEPRPLKREMAKGKPQDAHPATWAPFVLVGKGGR